MLLLTSFSSIPITNIAATMDTKPGGASSRTPKHLRPVLERRQSFAQGEPINAKGNGAPISGKLSSSHIKSKYHDSHPGCNVGGTNQQQDLQNPGNLGAQSTDSGVVPNLKWSFSDSKTRLFPEGWVREQVVTDLPASKDIAAAQLHLTKGALREMHWHRVVGALFVVEAMRRCVR